MQQFGLFRALLGIVWLFWAFSLKGKQREYHEDSSNIYMISGKKFVREDFKMNYYYEKQNNTEEVALRSDIVAKSNLKLPTKERSIFVMTYLRNNRLEYICEKLKITREV